ncbi:MULTISPECIES: type IVB secretion system protein IcmH/DotU [unclassified Pseudomonas]|uniref:type IVB secretion system protein IcmH/DotU n=1 Tax=unclassified Pseudomonas TaxID=196821 RepID=UPI0037FA6205
MNDSPAAGHDPDSTVLIPAASGLAATGGASPWHAAAPEALSPCGEGLNPLVRAANPLLSLVAPLRATPRAPDISALRERLVRAIQQFESQAQADRVAPQTIAVARYALCTLVDEAISSTPWGAGVWSSRSLLVTFHNEAGGGERFFRVLQRLSADAHNHLDLLELMYLCLALGLEGRYRVIEHGLDQLAVVRERLLGLIREHRGVIEQDLSPHWRAPRTAPRAVPGGLSLGGVTAVAAVLLCLVHLTSHHWLERASAPVLATMADIRLAPLPALVPLGDPQQERLSTLLVEEIAQGLVSVHDSADHSVVTLPAHGMFASGSAQLAGDLRAVLERVADALSAVPGEVWVVGHTDNQLPSPRARLASNAELSMARASSVAQFLSARAGPATRYLSEGRGDTEPLVPNDSPTNRARNRRVEITLFVPAWAQ